MKGLYNPRPVDDTPVNGQLAHGVTSNWAYDHAILTTSIHGVGAGAIVGTTLTQTLTNKTLTSPTINGTIATTGLTMPAFTAGGDISIGANKLRTTTCFIDEESAGILAIRNTADTAYEDLSLDILLFRTRLYAQANAVVIRAYGVTNNYLAFEAQDTGVGAVEVARLQGAADPYFQATLPMCILPVATGALPATPVEGMLAYDVTLHKLVVRVAAAWETVTSA